MNNEIKIQLLEAEIISDQATEVKDALDKDYKYMIGLAITDGQCSDASIIEEAKLKGYEFLPSGFEAVNLISSKSVSPNKRFFSLFDPVVINGDDLTIIFKDVGFSDPYTLKIQVLLTNNIEKEHE